MDELQKIIDKEYKNVSEITNEAGLVYYYKFDIFIVILFIVIFLKKFYAYIYKIKFQLILFYKIKIYHIRPFH